MDGDDLARISVTGLTALGQSTVQRVQSPIQTQQAGDNLLWVKGNHSIKTGLEFRRSSNLETNDSSGGGSFSFSDRATNSGLAALLLGWVNSATLVKTDVLNARTDYYGAYFQDDWKVSSRLTVNLGIRWESIRRAGKPIIARAVLIPTPSIPFRTRRVAIRDERSST